MSKMKAQTLVDKVADIAKNHKTLYVMGCFGAPLTGGNVTRYCNNHNYNKAADRTRMIKAAANQSPPVYGFDCVNLIKGVLWGWCGDPSRTYGGAAYPTKALLAAGTCPDVGADGMIKLCKEVSTTGWAAMLPGEAVWCSGHIGVYIGNGLAVECSPRWENKVQITAVARCGKKAGYNTRTWTKHGKLPWVDYTGAVEASAAIAKGSTVKVKTGAKTYTGGGLASFVYANTYTVLELSGDRAVIGQGKAVTAAVNIKDLTLVG